MKLDLLSTAEGGPGNATTVSMRMASHKYPVDLAFQYPHHEQNIPRSAPSTLRDVKKAIVKIQEQQEAQKEMVNMTRLQKFLEAMRQLEAILDESMNLKNHLAPIWRSLHFILQTSSTMSSSFDKILEAYENLGDKLPYFLQFHAVIDMHPETRVLLDLIYKNILEFHDIVFELLTHPTWRQLFRPLWQNYGARFEIISKNVQGCSNLLTTQADMFLDSSSTLPQVVYNFKLVTGNNYERVEVNNGQAHLGDQYFTNCAENEDGRGTSPSLKAQFAETLVALQHTLEQAKISLDRQEQTRLDEQYDRVLHWIAGPVMSDYHSTLRRDSCHPRTGRWILESPKVCGWLRDDSPRASTLWIHGIPGAGKTVLASIIIEACEQMQQSDTAYFYCRSGDVETNSPTSIMRALLAQCVRRKGELMPYFDEQRRNDRDPLLRLEIAQRLMDTVCRESQRLYIILDGVDECPPKQRKMILSQLSAIIKHVDQKQPSKARLLIVSQNELDIRRALVNYDEFELLPKHNKDDIAAFVSDWVTKIEQRFDLNAEQTEHIRARTCLQAEGQFLYAKLVMENLYLQPNLEALGDELRAFPKELKDAYERIIVRIRDTTTEKEWEISKKLLGWMTCAARPLKWHEMQGALSIDLEKEVVHFQHRQLRRHVKDICGALVSKCGDRITLVHGTARDFIAQSDHIDAPAVECELTTLCLQYITFDCFNVNIVDEDLRMYVLNGYYAFADYAVAKWMHHFERTVDSSTKLSDPEQWKRREVVIQAVVEAVQQLIEEHEKNFDTNTTVLQREDVNSSLPINTQGMLSDFDEAEENFQTLWTHIQVYRRQDTQARNTISLDSLGKAVDRIRQNIETIATTPSLTKEEGKDLMTFYGDRFFRCKKLTCYYFHEGFKDKQTRDKHVSRHDRPHQCPQPDCESADFGFSSKQDLSKHIISFHPDLELKAHLFKPVEIKPLTTKHICTKCDRSFSRRGILRAHELAHAGQKPYECPRCGKPFTRKNDCTRHEKIHDRRG